MKKFPILAIFLCTVSFALVQSLSLNADAQAQQEYKTNQDIANAIALSIKQLDVFEASAQEQLKNAIQQINSQPPFIQKKLQNVMDKITNAAKNSADQILKIKAQYKQLLDDLVRINKLSLPA